MARALSAEVQKFLDSRELFGWQLGLRRISRLARLFGNPERRYEVIHIAGSNGKGSTAAMLEAVLMAAGYRTGLYTSPHLLHLTERIRIAGAPIHVAQFETLLAAQRKALEKHGATYFEALTTVAFAAFAEARIEVAIVEVGLGGRLDATNIVRPKLCVIPSIAREHQRFLGRTLANIAREKAGILKRRAPCVIGRMAPQAIRVIQSRANVLQAPVHEASQLCAVREAKIAEDGNHLTVIGESHYYKDLHCKLVGRHQINNALCVIVGAEILNQQGMQISEWALRQGLRCVEWPGRFQILQQQPRLICDVAHNPAGMKALVQTYRQVYPDQQPVVVIGTLEDKDYVGMLRQWRGVAARLIACRVQSTRGRQPEDLFRAANEMRLTAELCHEPRQALKRAQTLAGRDGVVCVTGSHYLVGQLLAELQSVEPGNESNPRSEALQNDGYPANPAKIS